MNDGVAIISPKEEGSTFKPSTFKVSTYNTYSAYSVPQVRVILELEFFPYLNAHKGEEKLSLFVRHSRENIVKEDLMLVCWSHPDYGRLFTVFPNISSFDTYQQQINEEARNFFEVILGECRQKTHFDIDIAREETNKLSLDMDVVANALIVELKEAVLESYKRHAVILTSENVLIYSSHGKDKRSFHVIVNGWYHNSCREAEAVYFEVRTLIKTKEYLPFIDKSVYKSIQQFRILGSQKTGSGRPKIITRAPRLEAGKDLHDSLIAYTKECKEIKYAVIEKSFDNSAISDDTARKAVALAIRRGIVGEAIVFSEVKNSIIALRRVRPSLCCICKRSHEHENPYLRVFNDDVYYNCRRGNKSELLGNLSLEKITEADMDQSITTGVGIKEEGTYSFLQSSSDNQAGDGSQVESPCVRSQKEEPRPTALTMYEASKISLPDAKIKDHRITKKDTTLPEDMSPPMPVEKSVSKSIPIRPRRICIADLRLILPIFSRKIADIVVKYTQNS